MVRPRVARLSYVAEGTYGSARSRARVTPPRVDDYPVGSSSEVPFRSLARIELHPSDGYERDTELWQPVTLRDGLTPCIEVSIEGPDAVLVPATEPTDVDPEAGGDRVDGASDGLPKRG